jgi:hypothetical protein
LPALLYAFPVIALLLIEREFLQQRTWKIGAQPAMIRCLAFTTGFYRTAFSPKGLFDLYTTLAVHLLSIIALSAQYAAP